MDEHDEQGEARPETAEPAQEQKLSAVFLPYDDERLWVGMPGDQRGRTRPEKQPKKRPKKQRVPKPPSAPSKAEGSSPTKTNRLSRPIPFGSKRVAAAVLVLALPISAFAVSGAISGDAGPSSAPASTSSPTPLSGLVRISHLHVDRVTAEKVQVRWDAPSVDQPLTYSVYRDGVAVAETTDTGFTDTNVRPDRSYRYSVTATLRDGTLARSPELLVATPSETGAPTQQPSPSVPRVTSSAPSPSPSPSRSLSTSPSPTKTKVVWPSADLGGGQSICLRYQTTDPTLPCYSPAPL